MKQSAIGWCDYSGGVLNVVSGCTPASEGCANCYARAIADRYGRPFLVRTDPAKVEALRRLRLPETSPKRGYGRPLAFLVDTGDLFHPDVPSAFVAQLFAALRDRPDVEWFVLTKRAERMADMMMQLRERGIVLPETLWLGVSVENQFWANRRIRALMTMPGVRKFVSFEPLLGPVRLGPRILDVGDDGIGWMICGGESGPRRRPFDVKWARALFAESRRWDIPFFYKQGSAHFSGRDDLLDGRRVQEWPGSPGMLAAFM